MGATAVNYASMHWRKTRILRSGLRGTAGAGFNVTPVVSDFPAF
jgi:hypothetical protein